MLLMKSDNNYLDIQYVNRFRNGDEAAFEVIFKHYKNHIYYMGMQFFHHDSERAKDLVQNTFSEVYTHIGKLKSSEAFYVWMNRIAYRQGCNMLRYHSKDSTYYTTDTEETFMETQVSDNQKVDIVTEIQKKEAIEIILSSLNEMEEDKRLVGYLRYFEELSLKEISEITGMPENTVGSHLHRIKAKLKKTLISKGFTSSSCLGLLMVPNLISYFHDFVNMDAPVQGISTDSVKIKAKKYTTKSMDMKWMNIAKATLGFTTVLSVTSVAVIPMVKQNDTQTLEAAEFTNITYNQEITNAPVSITVKTSSQNYDAILLNDSADLTAKSNGTYELNLMKNGAVIDSEYITITSIDRDIPQVVNEAYIDDDIVFTIRDDLSGVNFDTVRYFEQDGVSIQVEKDEILGTITLPVEERRDARLQVTDFAGNVLEVKINSYKKSAI